MRSRREFLELAATTTVVAASASCGSRGRRRAVRLGSGDEGGLYFEFAQLLAQAAKAGGTVRIEPVVTSGSMQNLAMLGAGRVDAALALADSLAVAESQLLALGRVYENYAQLAVAAGSSIRRTTDLRGKRVALGANGSGAALTGDRMLWAAGLDPAVDVVVSHLSLADSVTALRDGRIDCLLWLGGVPTAALNSPTLRLLDIGELAGPMAARFGPFYRRVQIPAGAYSAGPVSTVGVANLLVAVPTMADSIASAITKLLIYRATELVPKGAAGTQFLDVRSLIDTHPIPLHPGAAAIYRLGHG